MDNREKAELPNVASAFSGRRVIKNKCRYGRLLSPGRETATFKAGLDGSYTQSSPLCDWRGALSRGVCLEELTTIRIQGHQGNEVSRCHIRERQSLKDGECMLAWRVIFNYLRDLFVRS